MGKYLRFKPATTLKEVATNAAIDCVERADFHERLAEKCRAQNARFIYERQLVKANRFHKKAVRINKRFGLTIV